VLAIDEAQSMPGSTLDALRGLARVHPGGRPVLQVVLFGQPELDLLLQTRRLRAVAGRIGISAWLEPLGFDDFQHYLQHRLTVAGWSGGQLWTSPARWWLWWASGGVPRIANAIAHRSLLLALGSGQHQVGWRLVQAAARECLRAGWRRRRAAQVSRAETLA
jgi:MSHA biogenesis protein MshM